MRVRRRSVVVAVVVAALAVANGASSQRPSAPGSDAYAPSVAHVQPLGVAIASCKRGYYKNVSGNCVHRPSSSPAGAPARCADGTYSYSQHASGTCSHHGGVARWIRHP
jgi:hypothetical protein